MKLFSQLQPNNINKGGFYITYKTENPDVVVVDDYNNPSPTYYPSTLHPQSLEKETPDNNSSLQLHLVEICPVTH